MIDLVLTLFHEADEKLAWADEAFAEGRWADAIYHGYTAFVNGAKALLLGEDTACNTQIGILRDFDRVFVASGRIAIRPTFEEHVLEMNAHAPSQAFASEYLERARSFLRMVAEHRERSLAGEVAGPNGTDGTGA